MNMPAADRRLDAVGLFFPRRCPVCQEVVEERGERICNICRTKLPYIRAPFCMRCGKPLLLEEKEYCSDCRRKRHWFERGRAPFVYDQVMRESIAGFKYGKRREYAAFYAEEILKRCAKDMLLWHGEAFVPVPLHPSRKRKRGFNQAELLARRIGTQLEIPVFPKALRRAKKTLPQKQLNQQERLKNLRQAFVPGNLPPEVGTVLLVDDIYTTGSTLEACAQALKSMGVKKVYGLTLCIGHNS